MGIVNITSDSFQSEGRHLQVDAAINHAKRLVAEGADILDLGAESTRPGAEPVSVQEEIDRLGPVVLGLRNEGVPISIDTRNPEVMAEMLKHGVDMWNDIEAFSRPESLALVRSSSPRIALCAMHMQGKPLTMQQSPTYRHVVAEVAQFFYRRQEVLLEIGVDPSRIVFDPGIGFGKTVDHNIALMQGLYELRKDLKTACAMLVGVSRKSLIGALTDRPADERLIGSVVGAIAAIAQGANIVRVHDVAATVDGIRVWKALGAKNGS